MVTPKVGSETERPRRVGIFGFKCDPPHIFHLLLAERARLDHNLDLVLIVPAGQPADKASGVTSKRLRLQLARAVTKGNPHFKVSSVEVDREGASYMSDTLRLLEAEYPAGTEFFLIIGEDRAPDIKNWHEPEVIVEKCTILCGPRFAGVVSIDWLRSVLPPGAKCGTVEINNSSTFIRKELKEGRPVRYLLDVGTEQLIKKLGLYGAESCPKKKKPCRKRTKRVVPRCLYGGPKGSPSHNG